MATNQTKRELEFEKQKKGTYFLFVKLGKYLMVILVLLGVFLPCWSLYAMGEPTGDTIGLSDIFDDFSLKAALAFLLRFLPVAAAAIILSISSSIKKSAINTGKSSTAMTSAVFAGIAVLTAIVLALLNFDSEMYIESMTDSLTSSKSDGGGWDDPFGIGQAISSAIASSVTASHGIGTILMTIGTVVFGLLSMADALLTSFIFKGTLTFEKLRFVKSAEPEANEPEPAPAPTAPSAAPAGVKEKLEQLESLKAAGLITEEEYNEKRKDILNF